MSGAFFGRLKNNDGCCLANSAVTVKALFIYYTAIVTGVTQDIDATFFSFQEGRGYLLKLILFVLRATANLMMIPNLFLSIFPPYIESDQPQFFLDMLRHTVSVARVLTS